MSTHQRIFPVMGTTLALALAGCGMAGDDSLDAVDTSGEIELAATPATAGAVENVPGTYHHFLRVDGQRRDVIVYVPEAARGPRPAPVVFMLHGTSGDGEKFYRISGWREKADAEGLIAVFPTALVHCFHEDENGDGDFDDPGELKVTTKWAAGKLGDPARMPLCTADEITQLSPQLRALADHPMADDIAFFSQMLDRMPLRYAVDTRRLYASGFSNGAAMTSRLALQMSDRFAAVASASGTLNLEPASAARPITVVLSLGELDDRFTEPMGVPAIPVDESALDLTPISVLMDRYQLLCSLGPDSSYALRTSYGPGASIAQFDYTESVPGARNQFRFMVIEGLGHQYPNGRNHPVVMADELWDVFRNETLNP